MIPATLQELQVRISDLVYYEKNARQGNLEVIQESLTRLGQYRPIVVREGTNQILAGNHTVKAAAALGWTHIAATYVDVTDDEAARIVLIDNRSNDLATYDDQLLIDLLTSLEEDYSATGYTSDDYADLIDALEAAEDLDTTVVGDPDSTPELPTKDPLARPGDLFQLGRHTVICGDATNPDHLQAVTGGQPAAAMWTDPPYGVDYVGKTKAALTIQNDGADGLDQLLLDAFQTVRPHLQPGAPVYVAHSDTRRISFETALTANGYLVRQNLIWVKNSLVMGRSDYHYQHEPILYGFTPGGTGRLGRGGPNWHGDHAQTTVHEIDKPARNDHHPTMKPVELIATHLRNSLAPGHTVLDPFGGSGSTLIAAHQHGATAHLVELDPRYVDVICLRYQQATGTLPTRNGDTVDFAAYHDTE